MKVRVTFIVEVDDDIRREINQWYGRPGLASRTDVQHWYESNGRSMDVDLSDLASRHGVDPEDEATE